MSAIDIRYEIVVVKYLLKHVEPQISQLLAKSKEEVMTEHVKKVVLELLVIMISHLGMEDLNTMYQEIVPWLGEPGNANRQKRAYQVNPHTAYHQ